jgi:hypothetical protein
MISQKKILLSLGTMVFGSTLAMSNMVYAGNPAESHDSTSPTRRVEDMNYTNLSYNTMAAQTGDVKTCNECHKQVDVDQVQHKGGHHYRKHHGHHGAGKTHHHHNVKHSTQK